MHRHLNNHHVLDFIGLQRDVTNFGQPAVKEMHGVRSLHPPLVPA